MTALKKTAFVAMAALTLGAGVAATSTPAAAQWRGGGYGGPVAAGVLGGLAVGAIAGSAAAGGYGYGPGYGYGGGCGWQRQPVVDAYGNFLGYRRVRVCY